MGHFSGVETIYYRICNMDRSVRFYTEVLGFELMRREGRDWAEFRVGELDFALEGELATAPHQGGATVVLRTPDIRALEEHLAEQKVQRGEVEDLGGAYLLEFYDPDGNRLMAMQPLAAAA
ncbi:MAG: VOC family protein [Thermoleophilia bacterium]|nr:VOC family protein [Thermoleophilia bacterium]